jgi:serine/threonine protein kinase
MTENIERRIGPYRLGQILGHGGSSTVYEAVDDRDGYLVALKIIATPTDAAEEDTLVRRLERSSRAVAGLSHPNIARVYETGEAVVSGSPANTLNTLPSRYIAMERVEGITLRERLKREGGPLSLAQAADILEQVARGLDAIHQAGVIHRDIKPSNILLGIDGKVKLTDFEIARRPNDTAVTLDGVMIGSPHYISPEQTTNQSATFASDLWSLGVVLYEMVVGKVPFAGENIPATLYQIAHGRSRCICLPTFAKSWSAPWYAIRTSVSPARPPLPWPFAERSNRRHDLLQSGRVTARKNDTPSLLWHWQSSVDWLLLVEGFFPCQEGPQKTRAIPRQSPPARRSGQRRLQRQNKFVRKAELPNVKRNSVHHLFRRP